MTSHRQPSAINSRSYAPGGTEPHFPLVSTAGQQERRVARDTPSCFALLLTLANLKASVDGGGRGGPDVPQGPEGAPFPFSHLEQAAILRGEALMHEAEGYEFRAEKWMDRWVVTVRVRLRADDGSTQWADLLGYQTGHHDWSDPHLEVQSLCMQTARRLE